jgi:hypothetical protein
MRDRLARVLLRDAFDPFTAELRGAGPATDGGMGFFWQPMQHQPDGSYRPAGEMMFKSERQTTSVTWFDVVDGHD